MRQFLGGLSALALFATAASATETITYSYDTDGRLVSAIHSGTVNNGAASCYTYDKADNRANLTVNTTGGACTSSGGAPTANNYSAIYTKTGPKNATYRPTISFTPASIGDANFTTISATTNGANGAVTVSSGTVTYTYNATASTIITSDTFTYTLSNAAGQTATGTVTVTIDVETTAH